MYKYEIESVDNDGIHYSEENFSTFDLTPFIKVGDFIKGSNNRKDVFLIDRQIVKITFKG